MSRHVGIVACSAEGAALCYRTFCVEGAERLGPHDHPEVSMHTHSLAEYVRAIDADDWGGVADLMLSSAGKLARCGAEVLICPDNTIHQALPLLRERSPLPWLHIAEVVAGVADARGFRRLAVTGTRWLVDSDVYPDALAARGIEAVRPSPGERETIHRVIMDELVYGVFDEASTASLLGILDRLAGEEACDAAVLGCTELPLVLSDANAPLATLDSTRLLARAALDWATGETHAPARP